MSHLNPSAMVFWGLSSGIGYLVADGRGALIGLVIALSISFLANILSVNRK